MRICVFCGASPGNEARYVDAARDVGTGLAERGIGVVYGGGRVGLMGALADAALGAGGQVIGVIPQGLVDRELAHPGLTELHVVETLHERKAVMADLADAFIALPGGLGTLGSALGGLLTDLADICGGRKRHSHVDHSSGSEIVSVRVVALCSGVGDTGWWSSEPFSRRKDP